MLAHKLGIFRHDYTIVDCGSKGSMPSYIQLLNKFRISYVVVYDQDHQAGKSGDAIASADKASERIESRVDAALGHCVVLVNDIEEELGITEAGKKNKPNAALAHVEAEGFPLSDSLRDKVKSVYEE